MFLDCVNVVYPESRSDATTAINDLKKLEGSRVLVNTDHIIDIIQMDNGDALIHVRGLAFDGLPLEAHPEYLIHILSFESLRSLLDQNELCLKNY